MNYKKSYTLWWVMFVVGVVVGFLPIDYSKSVALVIIFSGMIQLLIFFRCPHCKVLFDKSIPQYCPNCREKIN